MQGRASYVQRMHFRRKLWHMYDHNELVSRWGMTLARRYERRRLKRDLNYDRLTSILSACP